MENSDSEFEDIVLLYTVARVKRKRKHRFWVHEIFKARKIYGEYHHLARELSSYEDKFHEYFRMTPQQFEDVFVKIESDINKESTNYRESITARQRLAICLRFLATGDSYSTISFSYRVGKSTVSKIVKETCDAIWRRLQPIYMSEPTTDDWENIEKGFSERWNFPNCFGALDGKHVVITVPPASGSTYYKGTFSIVLLALVDDKYCFSVIDVGGYGSNSDGGVFKSSALGKKLQNHILGLPNDKPLPDAPELGSMPYVLVADEAFPLTTHTMRPVPGRGLNDEDRIYNYRLSYARRISENPFGILASRWRMYHRKIPLNPENVDSVVRATCVLHNMLQSQNQQSYSKAVNENEPIPGGILRNLSHRGCHATNDALEIRNKYKTYFSSVAGAVAWQREYCFGRAN